MLTNLLQTCEPIMQLSDQTIFACSEAPMEEFNIVDTIVDNFMLGGWYYMAIITLVLVCVMFAAWKAPAWVKALGKVAIAIGVFSFFLGLSQMAEICATVGTEVSFSVYCSGFRAAFIPVLYSIIVYIIVTIIDMGRRPRI